MVTTLKFTQPTLFSSLRLISICRLSISAFCFSIGISNLIFWEQSSWSSFLSNVTHIIKWLFNSHSYSCWKSMVIFDLPHSYYSPCLINPLSQYFTLTPMQISLASHNKNWFIIYVAIHYELDALRIPHSVDLPSLAYSPKVTMEGVK